MVVSCLGTTSALRSQFGERLFYEWRCELKSGGGLPRIVCFAELGPQKRDVTSAPRRFPVLTQPQSRLIYVWCVETQAEWDAAAGCLALRFSPNGPSKTVCHDDTSKIPCFGTITVGSDTYLVLGDVSRAGCGARLPRIAYFAKLGPRIDNCVSPGPMLTH